MKFRSLNLMLLVTSVVTASGLSLAGVEEKNSKPVFITRGVLSVEVMHNGKKVNIQRNQNRKNTIHKLYQRTGQGKIQPMHPFKPHAVETIGELELLNYLKQQISDDSILVIDSRTPAWVKTGTIPGSINIPFTQFKEVENTLDIMEEKFAVTAEEALNFKAAKTLVMFCNGNWCPQSPTAIRKLLALGYPAAKLKYFRGGMQNWHSLGLTVIEP